MTKPTTEDAIDEWIHAHVSSVDEFASVFGRLNALRRRRNRAEYPDLDSPGVDEDDARQALETARAVVVAVKGLAVERLFEMIGEAARALSDDCCARFVDDVPGCRTHWIASPQASEVGATSP